MSVKRYGFTDVGRLDPIETGRWCKAQDAIDILAAKDAEIAALREALAGEKILHDMTGEALRDAEACIKDLTEELEATKWALSTN